MSKELDKLTTQQIAIDLFNIVSNGKYNMNDLVYYFDRIDKTLTPPTEEEVCKELSEWLERDVKYSVEGEMFYFVIKGGKREDLIYQYVDGTLYLSDFFKRLGRTLRPKHLIMLGRFYEGEIK